MDHIPDDLLELQARFDSLPAFFDHNLISYSTIT
jgi:hypothetical protein